MLEGIHHAAQCATDPKLLPHGAVGGCSIAHNAVSEHSGLLKFNDALNQELR